MFGREGNVVEGKDNESGDASSDGLGKDIREAENSRAAKLA